jgi:hypothetical protein
MICMIHFAKSINVVNVFLEVLYLFQFFWFVSTEQGIASSGLKKDQHCNYYQIINVP